MDLFEIAVDDLIPYENNPRLNDEAVDAVAASIREFGFKVPIVIDKNNVIVCGHTRMKAAVLLGLDTVPAIRADDLTDEQVKAFRLADNKTAELADWDVEKLSKELTELKNFDMEQFGFEKLLEEIQDNKYTTKTEIPHYEIIGIPYELEELVDTKKAQRYIELIDESELGENEKNFLKLAVCRLYEFNYKRIAEYYAKASEEMQKFFEMLALVIVDYDNAIANGYVKLSKELEKIRESDNV